MPTILRVHGWRMVIYPNDHEPAHVHVIGPGWIVVVDLNGPVIRETIGCPTAEAKRVARAVGEHRAKLLQAWREYHG